MDIEEIKRGLRAEIKKRESEQYATFQCNIRQMCKDVLAKLEEQESAIAELKQKLAAAQLVLRLNKPEALYSNLETMSRLSHEIDVAERRELHQKYKRCLAMAMWCKAEADAAFLRYNWDSGRYDEVDFYEKWRKRWLELAEKFKEA